MRDLGGGFADMKKLFDKIFKSKSKPKWTKKDEELKKALLESSGMNAAEKEYDLIKNQGGGDHEMSYSLPDKYLHDVATEVAKWRYLKQEKSEYRMTEDKVVRFIRLYLETDKRTKIIEDFNKDDARMIWMNLMATTDDLTEKLLEIDKSFNLEKIKFIETAIRYKD